MSLHCDAKVIIPEENGGKGRDEAETEGRNFRP
jgi:hypothetical protein